jgi:hypothetical protein
MNTFPLPVRPTEDLLGIKQDTQRTVPTDANPFPRLYLEGNFVQYRRTILGNIRPSSLLNTCPDVPRNIWPSSYQPQDDPKLAKTLAGGSISSMDPAAARR